MKSQEGEAYSGLLSKYISRGVKKNEDENSQKGKAYLYGLMVAANEADCNPKNYLMDIEAGIGRIDHTSNFDHLEGFEEDPWEYENMSKWVTTKDMFEEWKFMESNVFQRKTNSDLQLIIEKLMKDPTTVSDVNAILKNYENLDNFKNFEQKFYEFKNICEDIYNMTVMGDSSIYDEQEELKNELDKLFTKMTRNMEIVNSEWKIVNETNFMYFLRGVVDYLQVPDYILEMVFNVQNYNSGVVSKKTNLISASSGEETITTSTKKISTVEYQSNGSSNESKSSENSFNYLRPEKLKSAIENFFKRSIAIFNSKLQSYNDDNLKDIDWQQFYEGKKNKSKYCDSNKI